MATIAQTKTGMPMGRGTARRCLPRRPGWVQSVPRRVAPRGPRYEAGGSPHRYISKVALFASGADLRKTRTLAGNRQTGTAFNSLRTNSRPLGGPVDLHDASDPAGLGTRTGAP